MKVDFPPDRETKQSEQMADRVMELAAKHQDMTAYDVAEIHLYWPEKEKEIHEQLIEREIKSPPP
jgi:hypothetical protein